MCPIEDLKPGMMIIPAGRKRAVEVLGVDNWANPNRYLIHHYGQGFAVTGAPAGTLIQVVG